MLCTNCQLNSATRSGEPCDRCVAAGLAVPSSRARATAVADAGLAPAPAAGLRSPVGLSYAVVALLGVVIVTDLFSIFVSYRLHNMAGDSGSGFAAVPVEDLEGIRSLMLLAVVLYYGALLSTAVVFITWFFRVRRNAGIFAPDLQRRGAGWAIGGWLIPFANLWIPRGVAADVMAASKQDPYGLGKSKGESSAVLEGWWIAWFSSMVFGMVAGRDTGDSNPVGGLQADAELMIIGDLLNITAAVFAILFVRMLTRMQQLKVAPSPVKRPVLN